MIVRDLIDADWEAVAEIMNVHDSECVSADALRDRNSAWVEGDSRQVLVAMDDNGDILGYARSIHRSADPEGKFHTSLYVRPDAEGRGIGRELYARNEAFALAHGALRLTVGINDWGTRGEDFAKRNGFYPTQHLFESKLDLTAYDPTLSIERQRKLEEAGYQFFSLEEVGDTTENWKRMHHLDSVSDLDTPGYENWGPRTFERYLQELRESADFTAGGVFIGDWRGEWVAIHMVKNHGREGEMQTDYSGVLREHRGKGLAQVLKMLGAEYCRASGAKILSTHNDERNAPMLAINAKLGFVVEPGFRFFRKDIEELSAEG